MLPIIDPEEDYLTIVAAEEKIASAESKRKKELDEAYTNLKGQLYPREYEPLKPLQTSLHSTLQGFRSRASLFNTTSLSPVSRSTCRHSERARYHSTVSREVYQ
jgi:hypothetical protein